MMTFAFFLLGGLAGIFAWLYIVRFIPNLQQEIYQNYIELYPENRPIFHSEKAAIQSQKCGHIFLYFLGFGLCFAVLYYFLQNELFTLWLAITLSLLFVISWLDWHYQLISPTPCLLLFFLGLLGAHQEFSILTLSQSLESAVSFFGVFYIIYHLSKCFYKKEALGRGDYWLALGIGTYLTIEHLPLFLFIACLLGIIVYWISRKSVLPFAPFLCISLIVTSAIIL